MATLLLAAAGTAVGSTIGGTALGFSLAGIGQALGAVAGSALDQTLLGSGGRVVEQGRARSLRLQTATEGQPIPLVFGRMRLGGTMIWSTRFLERVRTTTQGGKGAPEVTVREYSYSISFAVGLCEGRIDRVGRIWADGKPLDTRDLTLRVYDGGPEQMPDPKIEAVEGAGNAPAYRGLAYVVFEDLPLERFGNRIPQLNFEVFRPVNQRAEGPEAGEPLSDLIEAVALSPGTGEHALDPEVARLVFEGGEAVPANVNAAGERPDIMVALDQLEAELPRCGSVSLIVSWFGDDLRCGRCRVEPRAEAEDRTASPEAWGVGGLTAQTARLVGRDTSDRPIYGGTPSDGSVVRAIRELKARGQRVLLYPFLLMDIPEGNGLPDPYGRAEQPPYPWRGRITLDAAPGQSGSTDLSAAAAEEVDTFFGTVTAADFSVSDGTVTYSGPDEWSWSRFALHLAALGAAAGGVEAICIGTEMRGLTWIRSARTIYPAVDRLRALAGEVRALLPEAKISYAADWSEYFGHHPADGSGDRIFHLDPFWADPNVDFVGIDDYLPLSDWRHTGANADRAGGAVSVYSLPYLQSNMEGGEHFDFYYASNEDRTAQIRTPIADTAHGEDWIFRPKDIRNWWANRHHDRIGGVRQTTPTAWQPRSKPIWLTETGCPAVDLGANMPNLFFDPKSSESAFPPFSSGARDDEMQRRYLQAKLGWYANPANNPVSEVYGGPMVPTDRIHVWTWDARPFPDFPMRASVWSDGPSHQLGHWITGRVTAGGLADVVHELTARAGVAPVDVSRLFGTVHGYVVDRTGSAREAVQPLALAYGFDAFESGGSLTYVLRGLAEPVAIEAGRVVESEDRLGPVIRERASRSEAPEAVRLAYVEGESDYRMAAAEARLPEGDLARVSETSMPIALPTSTAQAIAERWLTEGARARDRLSLALPPSAAAIGPADVIALAGPGGTESYRIERLTQGLVRNLEAVRIEAATALPPAAPEARVETPFAPIPGPLEVIFLDLPVAEGGTEDHWPHIAVAADPWPGAVSVFRSASDDDYGLLETLTVPALTGALVDPLPPGDATRWQRVSVEIRMRTGGISSADRLSVLNGANPLAVETGPDLWEILQFRDAELAGPGRYRIGTLLRGRRGTEHLAARAIGGGARLVLLDSAVRPLEMAPGLRGLPRHYRVVRSDRPITDPDCVHAVRAFDGVGLRPFSPAHLAARRLEGGDLVLTWVRRTRIGGDTWAEVEVPLGEAREAYRIRVLKDGALRRKADTSQPAWTYTAAQQTADGVQPPFELRVAQLSDAWGYGPEKGIIVHD